MDKNSPIVVFDSGVGGVSVLRALVRELPGEDFVYFGDSANAPYGPRPTEEIRALTLAALTRLKAELGPDAPPVYPIAAGAEDLGEFPAALRQLVTSRLTPEEAAARHL